MIHFNITPTNKSLTGHIQNKIDTKIKPPGALGRIEEIGRQICLIQQTLTPELKKPFILVFAADHGIAEENVSAFLQDVTYQMVLNFVNGGAAINVFCRQNNINLIIIDAGVKHNFAPSLPVVNSKISLGTKNFATEPAMTEQQCLKCLQIGAQKVQEVYEQGCNIIGFGEMGIANTTPATAILSLISKLPLAECTGRGTGISDAGLEHKINVLTQAIKFHNIDPVPLNILKTFGGFEINMICGAILKAAELKMTILIDGFIVTAASLAAYTFYPEILDYCIFCHKSNEQGHRLMLSQMRANPLLDIGMRLGEGTGAAVAYPVIQSAVNFINQMASFESGNVSDAI